MSITDWPVDERPREKLMTQGAASLSDAELLAIFLRIGVTGKSAVELADELLAHFGSLAALFDASESELSTIKGMGDAKYAQLQAILEMSRRALASKLSIHNGFENSAALKSYIEHQLHGQTTEQLIVLFFSPNLTLIACEVMSTGTQRHTDLPIRAIAQRALTLNAHGLVLAHNHPHGHAEPSIDDITSTVLTQKRLEALDLHILDHFIVAEGQSIYSMVEHGDLITV